MSYSGNPALSSDVKQRIVSTFDQTLELARDGNRQEALLGCDFVLRMDPQFQPAHVLQERLRATTGRVDVDDLGATAALPDPFADLEGLSLDLPDALPDHGGGSLRAELKSLADQRRFPKLMAAAQRQHAAVMADPELQRLVSGAQEAMEAEPYVLKFLGSARAALQAGDAAETARLLDKARALDPTHPGIAELDRARAGGSGPTPAKPLKIPSPLKTGAMPVSLAVGGGDSESDRRIRELLDEGQTALDGGDPQGAIDSWSRIFLIDIDHQEAGRRIEAARKLKAENERQAEEIFHDGVARLESGDAAAARRSFQRVLEIQPGYFAAREYLQQIDAGAVPMRSATPRDPLAGIGSLAGAASSAVVAEPAVPAPAPPARKTGTHDLKEEILVPPEPPGEAVPAERWPLKKPAAAGRRDKGRARRLFLLVGGAVLLLALAGAFYFFQNREQLFPNSKEEAPAPAPTAKAANDPIARAERLHKAGRTTTAVSQLKHIPPNDPHYAKAQALIAQWGGDAAGTAGTATAAGAAGSTSTAGAPGAPGATGEPAPPLTPDALARRAAFLAAAHQAADERSSFKALLRLEAADALAKLDGDDARLLADTRKKLEPLNNQIDLFHQHEWERVLPQLWRLHGSDPSNRDVTQMIVDCYYDLALRDLQRTDAAKAAASLKEAVNLQPGDELLRRHYVFAQTYQERPKDLLYRIYVKYLPYR
jgi:tetratricopeptide (TPR) repeat protein